MTIAAATPLERFISNANDLFRITGERRGRNNPGYIDVPVRVGEGYLPGSRNPLPGGEAVVNPLLFLSGIFTSRTVPMPNQWFARSPSVSLLVGQYGLGKTELMFQLCDHMESSVDTALPVNLSLCRDRAGLLDEEPTAERFAALVFGRIADRAGIGKEFLLGTLASEIRRGNILLLLDGLDELIAAPEEHTAFVAGLMKYLAHGADESEAFYRVVLSMRLEYFSVATNEDDVVKAFEETDDQPAVYFLALDYLGDSEIETYLDYRAQELGNARRALEEIRHHGRLLDMLRRPLLLRIFCDLARQPSFNLQKVIDVLARNEGPCGLLDLLTESAMADPELTASQNAMLPVTWDPSKLALRSIELYSHGLTELTVDDLRAILVPAKDAPEAIDIAALKPHEVVKGIHKCPFLREEVVTVRDDSDNAAVFAHRIFFEYFTVRGIVIEMRTEQMDPKAPEKRAFDELVLNVDMRKFLHGFLSGEEWKRETRFSYGLDDSYEWPHDHHDFEELDRRRWTLLRSMTDPENLPEDPLPTIRWLLGGDTGWLHPRYLLYNYEAVAVYLWYQRAREESHEIREAFDRVLRGKLEELLAGDGGNRETRRANALLLERLLDIGRRLRYAWARDAADYRQQEILDKIDPADADITGRVRRLLKEIRSLVFVPASPVPRKGG